MQLNALNFYFRHFAEQQMNFLYTGDFDDEHTDSFIELNNQQYNAADEYKKMQRKAGFLIAECFQNIVRHHDHTNRDSYFHICNDQGLFSIVSANRVQNDIIPSLKSQLTQLNKLTSAELKETYRKTLSEGTFSDKGGAGLGFIEMARRSNNKLSFAFDKIDESNAYFYFRLFLNLQEDVEAPHSNDFNESRVLRSKMLQDQLYFVYKGIISIQTTIVILGIIEKSLDSINQKVVFVKFMGLFEKLSQLNYTAEEENACMLLIGEDEASYSIAASCYLDQGEATRLERIMKLYSTFDQEKLNQAYKQILRSKDENKAGDCNLELIEILKTSSNFEFTVQSYSEDTSLLSLVLKFQKKKPSKIQIKGQTSNSESTTKSIEYTKNLD